GDSLLSCFYGHPILRTDSSECGIPPLTSGRVARSSRSRWARAARSDRAPYWNARRASSCFRDHHGSELRGGLDEKGPAWALDSIEVEGRFVGEVLHLERRAHGHSLAADEVPEPGRVEELRVDRLLQVAETDALPAPEVLVHVAGRPGERELV